MTLVLRHVSYDGGGPVDMALTAGKITCIRPHIPTSGQVIDATGLSVLAGLHDHHLHLLATAARDSSVDLAGLLDETEIRHRIAAHAAKLPLHGWIRAIDYDERACGLPDRQVLDRWSPLHPLRVQDRTGALWVLNSAALAGLAEERLPPGAQTDPHGTPNGRFWREDPWLRRMLPGTVPDLTGLGRRLASLGLAGVTDATAHNGSDEAAILGAAQHSGTLPQRLILMGSEKLPEGADYKRGPLKLLIDERAPPDLDHLAARIEVARAQGRAVAAHCVTVTELALFLAALDTSGGSRPGDRIEHGGLIPQAMMPVVAAVGLTVITNPAFIHGRGDRYLASVAPADLPDLYRAGSLTRAGISLLAGSDAPYGALDPWLAMRAARDRITVSGAILGADERLDAQAALRLFMPIGQTPTPRVGDNADLILCKGNVRDILADLTVDRLRATIVAGAIVWWHGELTGSLDRKREG